MPALKPRGRPARPNQISRHPERVRIEMARLAGVSLDRIAAKWGVHRDAIARHMAGLSDDYRAQLIADVPLEAIAKRAREEETSLLDHFATIRMTVIQQMLAAASCNDRHATASLARAGVEVGREIGKLTGEIQRLMPGVTINNTLSIIHSPGFAMLEAGLLGIVQRHPEVRDDVIGLVRRLKNDAPATIEGERADA